MTPFSLTGVRPVVEPGSYPAGPNARITSAGAALQYGLCRATGYSRIAAATAVLAHALYERPIFYYPKWKRNQIKLVDDLNRAARRQRETIQRSKP